MKITEIEAGYAETLSLPGYNNVRPSMRLVAQVEEGEADWLVRLNLQVQTREAVQAEIDNVLVAIGKAPRYSSEPRYQVMESVQLRVVAVLPDDQDWDELPGQDWSHRFVVDKDVRGLLGHQAQHLAQQFVQFATRQRNGWRYIDCSDGDLSRLPELPEPELPEEESDANGDDGNGEEIPF